MLLYLDAPSIWNANKRLILRKQALRSSCELPRTKDSKRLKPSFKSWVILKHSVFYVSVFISSLLRVSEGAMAGLQCYIGNCTSMEECRRPELVTDCPHDQAYDACLSIIVQKGRLFYSCYILCIYLNDDALLSLLSPQKLTFHP